MQSFILTNKPIWSDPRKRTVWVISLTVLAWGAFLLAKLTARPPQLSLIAVMAQKDIAADECSSLYKKLWPSDIQQNGLTEGVFCGSLFPVIRARYERAAPYYQGDRSQDTPAQGGSWRTYVTKSGYQVDIVAQAVSWQGQPKVTLREILSGSHKAERVVVGDVDPYSPQYFEALADGIEGDLPLFNACGLKGVSAVDPMEATDKFMVLAESVGRLRAAAERRRSQGH